MTQVIRICECNHCGFKWEISVNASIPKSCIKCDSQNFRVFDVKRTQKRESDPIKDEWAKWNDPSFFRL